MAFLRAFLEAAGYRVHVYTSPHLVRFNERIRVAGHLIAEDALLALLEECERVNAGAPVTFFEITTAVAFLAFARTKADVALLETGLGGRFDATNVIAHPAVTAITPISLDHQHFLGDTIAKIAFEKAGILKHGAPAVLAAQSPAAEAVLEARARDVGAPLARSGREWAAARDEGRLRLSRAARALAAAAGPLGAAPIRECRHGHRLYRPARRIRRAGRRLGARPARGGMAGALAAPWARAARVAHAEGRRAVARRRAQSGRGRGARARRRGMARAAA